MTLKIPRKNRQQDEPVATETPAPRRRRKETRPAELIEAGLQEFALNGFAATRLDDVARRAGVAKGTIYLYFADKEALFMAAARSRIRPVLDEVAASIDAYPGTTRDLLAMIFATLHRQLVETDLRILIRILIAEGERFPALSAYYYEENVAKGRELLGRIVARGIARGEVRPGPTADLPIVLIAPVIMAAIWRLVFDRHAPIATDAFVAAHCDLVFNGLLVPD